MKPKFTTFPLTTKEGEIKIGKHPSLSEKICGKNGNIITGVSRKRLNTLAKASNILKQFEDDWFYLVYCAKLVTLIPESLLHKRGKKK